MINNIQLFFVFTETALALPWQFYQSENNDEPDNLNVPM